MLASTLCVDVDRLFNFLIWTGIEGATPLPSSDSPKFYSLGIVVSDHNTPSVEQCP